MIRVAYSRDWARGGIERQEADWGIGATAERLAPSWLDEHTACTRNGAPLPRAHWDRALADGDSLHFYARPGFVAAIPTLAGGIVGVSSSVGFAGWNAALVAGILSSVVSRLLLPSKKPTKRGDNESSTWGFNANTLNVSKEGTGIPVTVGRHRSAPPIITQFVRTRLDEVGNPVSELHTLMLVSEGPIQAIGDKAVDGGPFSTELGNQIATLQINNQPAENYRDVEAHVRIGGTEQTAIPGIANPSTQYGVGQTLTFPRAKHKTSFSVTGSRAFSYTPGTPYTDGGTVTLVGGTGTAATFKVTAPAGTPTAVSLLNGGNYTVAPPSLNPTGTGVGALGVATTGGGGTGLTIEPDFDSLISAVGDSASDPTGGTNTPGLNTAIATPGVSTTGSTNVTKWAAFGNPVSYTMGEDADEFAAIMSLPEGLGDFTGANPAANTVAYQARYRQVDAGGTPFGDYIVLEAERLALARDGLFQVEYRRKFFATSGYAPPTLGHFLRGRTGNGLATNRGASCPLNSAQIPVRALPATDFSFAGWFRGNAAVGLAQRRCLMNWLSGNAGIKIDLLSPVLTGESTYLAVTIGNGSATREVQILAATNTSTAPATLLADGGTNASAWVHVAVTWDGDGAGNTNGVLKFYVNGVLRDTVALTAGSVRQMLLSTTATWRVQSDSLTPTAGFNCDTDEPTIWSRTLTAFDVSRMYNQRNPLSTAADATGLLAGGRFDGTQATTGLVSFGPAASGNWVLGDGVGADVNNPNCSGDTTVENGIVKTLEAGTAQKGRYLVEMQRLTLEDAQVGLLSRFDWDTIELTTYQEYQYPSCALLYVKVRATDQLNGGKVPITVRHDGLLMPVWDGVDPVHPNIVDTWTRNPAWIAAGILTNRRWGLGGIYSIASLDLPMFKILADYCDELIYDNDERELLVTARQLESADTATDPNMAIVAEDCVRYRFAGLPPNFPQATAGKVATGKFITLKTTGTPSPAVPAWLTTQINAGPQEVVYVAFDSTSGEFYVYCKSSAAVVASSALYTPTPSGVNFLEGEIRAARYYFDGVFDQAGTKAWDAVVQVLQVARAAPVRIGSRVTLFVDKPGTPVALVGMGSVIAGSWRSNQQGIRGRHNAEEAEFFDEDQNYERRPVQDELPDVTDPTKSSAFHRRRIKLEGITRKGQGKRHLRRDLQQLNLQRRMASWEMGVDALPFQPGDLIDFSHDVPGYGISGRILEDAANASTFKHDREDAVVLESGKTYQVQLEHASSNTRETKTISSAAGTYPVGTTLSLSSPFSAAAEENDEYVIGEIGKLAKTYRVLECTRDPQTLRVRLAVIEYDAAVYDDDFGTFPTGTITNLPAPSAPAIPPGVENLTATDETTTGPDGSVHISSFVSFSHVTETYPWVEGADVYVSQAGQTADSAELVARLDARTTSCRISYPFERHREYLIFVVPRAIGGQSLGRQFVSYVSFTPAGLALPPKPPKNLRAVMSGKRMIVAWDDPGDGDQAAVVEIRQGGWILGTQVAVVPAQSRSTPPLEVWSSGPLNSVGVTSAPLYARTKLKTGQYSEEVAVLDFAPAPVALIERVLKVSEEDGPWDDQPQVF